MQKSYWWRILFAVTGLGLTCASAFAFNLTVTAVLHTFDLGIIDPTQSQTISERFCVSPGAGTTSSLSYYFARATSALCNATQFYMPGTQTATNTFPYDIYIKGDEDASAKQLVCGGNRQYVNIPQTTYADCINGQKNTTISIRVNPFLSAYADDYFGSFILQLASSYWGPYNSFDYDVKGTVEGLVKISKLSDIALSDDAGSPISDSTNACVYTNVSSKEFTVKATNSNGGSGNNFYFDGGTTPYYQVKFYPQANMGGSSTQLAYNTVSGLLTTTNQATDPDCTTLSGGVNSSFEIVVPAGQSIAANTIYTSTLTLTLTPVP